jgi:hypothetical protein
MIALRDALGQKIGRSDGRESAKVINEMRLIVVAVRECRCRPIDVSMGRQRSQGFLETADALKKFRRQANLLAENSAESALT